ncbi:MAG: DNA primase [Terrimicrobiaceae bacterium]
MPRIAEETIQRVAEANDIVEVVGSYFPLKRAGTSWVALCPFHREKSPSFHVNPQRQSYHCFGCGAGGSVFRFVMEYEHLDFVSAVRRLAQRAGIPVIEEAGSADDDRRHELRKRLLALHVEAAAWFHHNLLKTPAAQTARDYLKSRGVTVEVAKSWQLGFAPDSWDALLDFLRGKSFSLEEIAQSGLSTTKEEDRNAKPYARFRDRVMFPIRNDYGEVIAFSGRVLDPEARTAKYVNSPETPLFTKGRVLYGLDKSKRALINAKVAIVCEGQLDLISAFEAGVQNVIAPQGTAFTADQARVLQRFVETVVLCFDSDRAGQEAVTRSLPALLENGLEVKVARLPEGEDPDSLIRGQGPAAFEEVVATARNFFDHALEILAAKGNLGDPAGKSTAARRLGPYVALIKDRVLREATANKICARLGIAAAAFAPLLKPAAPQNAADAPVEAPPTQPLVLAEGIRQLCRLALLHPEAKIWLAEQSSPEPAGLGEGGSLLEKILQSALPLHEAASRTVFVSSLSPREEITVNLLDLDRPQENALPIAQNLWFGLAATALRNERDAASVQLRQAGLSPKEQKRLQSLVTDASKRILDLQSRVNEV